MSSFLHLLVVVLLLSWLSTAVFAANPIKPLLMLSNVYLPGEHHQTDFDISTFWVSEKLDGVRAYWDGTSLLTRSGHPIHAPKWFIDAFPSYALDGELWIGRGRFDEISSVIRKRFPNDPDWNNVQYMVFDLPESKEVFEHRYQALVKQVDELGVSWIKSVE